MKAAFFYIAQVLIIAFFALLAIYMGYIIGQNKRRKPAQWTDKNLDCASCEFQERLHCRRFPPSVFWKWGAAAYPKVWIKDPNGITQYWQNACSEYRLKERPE